MAGLPDFYNNPNISGLKEEVAKELAGKQLNECGLVLALGRLIMEQPFDQMYKQIFIAALDTTIDALKIALGATTEP